MKQLVQPHRELYLHTDALRWAVHVGEALAYLHSAIPKVIHRDLKLENVLLCGTGPATEAKLAVRGYLQSPADVAVTPTPLECAKERKGP